MKRMFALFVMAVMYLQSSVAVASLATVERWRCSREGLSRTLRHVAVQPNKAPCKIYYYKHVSDQADAQEEARQDAGSVHPIYYSDHTNDFCVKKMQYFLEDREAHDWTCVRL